MRRPPDSTRARPPALRRWLALLIGVLALTVILPTASASIDVSADTRGVLIESRGDSPSHVRIGETGDFAATRPLPAGSTEYFISGNPCGRLVLSPQCSRVKPGTLLCRSALGGDGPVACPRTTQPRSVPARIRVRFGDGDDILSFGSGCCRAVIDFVDDLRGDPVSVVAGGGDDVIRAFVANAGETPTIVSGTVATGRWTASLGAGDDRYSGSDGRDVVNGGTGDDVIESDGTSPRGGAADVIRAGSGRDRVDPGPGRDVVLLGAGTDRVDATDRGPDSYDGGTGVDTITYRLRTAGITAGVAFTSAGERGEGDVLRNFERVEGGRGPDRILGFRFGIGGPGDDVITGGNSGRFFLTGGPGEDTLRGFAGNDIINARDGEVDRPVRCGAGRDIVLLDDEDPAPADGSCEDVRRR